MNYEKIYYNLVSTRKARKRIKHTYYERHHVLPKCLGGKDSKENIVYLTPREHFLAHWLLIKIYPLEYKLHYALALMSGELSPKSNRQLSSKYYIRCAKAKSDAMKIRHSTNKQSNHMKTPEMRKLFSERMKGNNNPMKKYPDKHYCAYPVTVVFSDGTTQDFSYSKKAYTDLNIPRATWQYASKRNKGIPSRGIKQIIKHHKSNEQKEHLSKLAANLPNVACSA